ncbi:C-type lectin domain family 7 member A-like [Mixophyes fleayi]|uniref:C-type lectin domain family 7 member A-like n=1 Tax=Mixophyes fleayi TaxID=3061075 RepID=UPI003F4D8683
MADNAYAEMSITRKAEKPDNPSCVAQAGRRSYLLLFPTLIAACLTLLISTVYLRATCRGDLNTPSNGPKTSSSPNRTEVNTISHGSETTLSPGLCPTCPAHWILIDNKCYFFSEIKKSYHESERNCRDSGSRLATVKEGGILVSIRVTGRSSQILGAEISYVTVYIAMYLNYIIIFYFPKISGRLPNL